jgi:hypothetical protein
MGRASVGTTEGTPAFAAVPTGMSENNEDVGRDYLIDTTVEGSPPHGAGGPTPRRSSRLAKNKAVATAEFMAPNSTVQAGSHSGATTSEVRKKRPYQRKTPCGKENVAPSAKKGKQKSAGTEALSAHMATPSTPSPSVAQPKNPTTLTPPFTRSWVACD